jgi:hypothetical protein
MRGFLLLTALTLSAPIWTACATMNVSSHVQRGLDITQYRTYDWGPADALPTGDPCLDQDPYFQDHVQGAFEKQMAALGFERANSENRPDLLIHYHASITQRIDVDRLDQTYGYCYEDDCRVHVTDYEAGTLVLDIVDARTNRVIWRGWAQHNVEGVLGHRDKTVRKIGEAVRRMLERLPTASAGPVELSHK